MNKFTTKKKSKLSQLNFPQKKNLDCIEYKSTSSRSHFVKNVHMVPNIYEGTFLLTISENHLRILFL